jgi:hypothetical protein
MTEGVWAFVDRWINSLWCRLDRSLGRWIGDWRQRFYDTRLNFPRQIESDGPWPRPNRYATDSITVGGSKNQRSRLKDPTIWSRPTRLSITMKYLRFNRERSSPDRRLGPFLPRTILFTLERGCGILPAVAGPSASGGCYEAMDEMSLWLMAWVVMVACIYIAWEVGG